MDKQFEDEHQQALYDWFVSAGATDICIDDYEVSWRFKNRLFTVTEAFNMFRESYISVSTKELVKDEAQGD